MSVEYCMSLSRIADKLKITSFDVYDVQEIISAMRSIAIDLETEHLLDYLHKAMQEELFRMSKDDSWRDLGRMPGR